MLTIEHKVGATLVFGGLVASSGTPVDLTGYTLTSQFRTPNGTLEGTASLSLADQGTSPGVFTATVATTTTEEWVVGTTVLFDVRLESSTGVVTHTTTVAVRVLPRQTTS